MWSRAGAHILPGQERPPGRPRFPRYLPSLHLRRSFSAVTSAGSARSLPPCIFVSGLHPAAQTAGLSKPGWHLNLDIFIFFLSTPAVTGGPPPSCPEGSVCVASRSRREFRSLLTRINPINLSQSITLLPRHQDKHGRCLADPRGEAMEGVAAG